MKTLPVRDFRKILPLNGSAEQREVSDITTIAVHHSADVVDMEKYNFLESCKKHADIHIRKDWTGSGVHGSGIMYHFKISPSGEIAMCRNLEDVTWHCRDGNPYSIGVCVDGNYQSKAPSDESMESLKLLLGAFTDPRMNPWGLKIGKTNILGHQEVQGNATVCPGLIMKDLRVFRNMIATPRKEIVVYPHDIDLKAWFGAYAYACFRSGVLTGSGGKWSPSDPVNRAQMAKIICEGIRNQKQLMKSLDEAF